MRNRLVVFLFVIFFVGFAFAQKQVFRTYSTSAGLPQSQVNSMCQDDDGFLWVGTLGGVARFNGDYFKTFSSENGLYNNRVSKVVWIDGTIWLGHDGGVSTIKDSKVTSISLPDKYKETPVTDIIKFGNEIIVSLNGGGLVKIKNNKSIDIKGMSNEELLVRDLHIVDNVLYLATRKGVLQTKDLKSFKSIVSNLEITISGLISRENELIFTSYDGALFYYNTITKVLKEQALSNPEYTLLNLTIDKSGRFWVGTQFGVLSIEGTKEDLIDINRGLPINNVSCVYEDRDGNIWMGTQGKGLVRAPRGEMIYYDDNTGLKSDLVVSGFQSSTGAYYFGTFDVGVVKMAPNAEFQVIDMPFNNTVWSAQHNVDGKNWFGTRASLVAMSKAGQISVAEEIPEFKITCFHKVSNAAMYLGGSRGVWKYDKGKFIEIAKNQENIGTARNILKVENHLYVASDMGLFELKNKRFELVRGFDNTVFSLAKDEKNTIYFGTEDGLFQLKNGKISRIKFAKELASNYINFLNYRKGVLYVGTNNGLYILTGFDQGKELKVDQIGQNDGLIDLETNLNSSFFDNKGDLWFGTSSGLVRFNPSKFTSFKPKIKLNLAEVLLNYQMTEWKEYSDRVDNNNIPLDLVLPHNKNNLLFNFDAVSLSRFSNLDFQYWLEGLEENWSPLTKNTSVSFSSLPSGVYVLHARITDVNTGSSDEITFSFVVKPPFYARWWFIALMALLIGLIIIGFFRFRIRREKEISANELIAVNARLVSLEQQSLNASMNRHFIFNSLNSIQYFINNSDKLSANKYLTNFAKLIRKNLDSSAEKNSMVTLSQEIERIELYLSLESMRFKDRFEYNIETGNIDLEAVMIPAMLIQPFVENSIIHGILPDEHKKGHILIKVYSEGDNLVILVQDNGVGIDKSMSQKATMFGDHKSQGMEITAKRIDLIKLVSNQNLELIGPEQINDNDGSINGTRVLLKIRYENLEN